MIKDNFLNLFTIKKAIGVEYKRIGSKNDGGYINVNDISNNDFAISFGISDNVDWEKGFMQYGAGIDCYDNSINGLPENIFNSRFFKKTVGVDINLSECINLSKWNKDFVLKMDIEGSEWEVIQQTSFKDLSNFRQILIEYHWILDKLNNKDEYEIIKSCIDKISDTHTPVWIHANNYGRSLNVDNRILADVVEVLYLRNSSYKFEDYSNYEEYYNIFNSLNMPNTKNLNDILVSFSL